MEEELSLDNILETDEIDDLFIGDDDVDDNTDDKNPPKTDDDTDLFVYTKLLNVSSTNEFCIPFEKEHK